MPGAHSGAGWPRRRFKPWYFYAALAGYVAVTSPLRAWTRRRLARDGRAPVLVLTYHRIADDHANAWTCSNALFERHVRWLRDRFDMVSLQEAQRRIRDGNRRACVSVTFDDGYAANCARALPLLAELAIPFTYFVTLENVSEGKPFTHDVAMGNAFPPNSIAQLRELGAAGAQIGCHGWTHRDVAALTDPQDVVHEIAGAKRDLEALVHAPVLHYAFPFGEAVNLSKDGFAVARQAGFMGACSSYGGYNIPGDDPFHIQRHSGSEDMMRLFNWATHDWRKASIPRFGA
jgi:peptidoglycan/xylan/chitin deacetylase (PgdA/CDA1 family)